jgi:hypothetical protein
VRGGYLAVQMRARHGGDEELRVVGVGAFVGHGQHACTPRRRATSLTSSMRCQLYSLPTQQHCTAQHRLHPTAHALAECWALVARPRDTRMRVLCSAWFCVVRQAVLRPVDAEKSGGGG